MPHPPTPRPSAPKPPPSAKVTQLDPGVSYWHPSTGPTLRQMYAMHAMQGELSSQSKDSGHWKIDTFPNLALRSFLLADAMLYHEAKEREGK